MAVQNGWKPIQLDARAAFLWGNERKRYLRTGIAGVDRTAKYSLVTLVWYCISSRNNLFVFKNSTLPDCIITQVLPRQFRDIYYGFSVLEIFNCSQFLI